MFDSKKSDGHYQNSVHGKKVKIFDLGLIISVAVKSGVAIPNSKRRCHDAKDHQMDAAIRTATDGEMLQFLIVKDGVMTQTSRGAIGSFQDTSIINSCNS